MGRSSNVTVDVRADGTGLSSRAGTALLALAADRLGLTDALGGALAETRERRAGDDPGRGLCGLAGVVAGGGGWGAGLGAPAAPPGAVGGCAVGPAGRGGGVFV